MARRPRPAPAMGRGRLEWMPLSQTGAWQAVSAVPRGYLTTSMTYEDRTTFALVRPALAGDALFAETFGYVVTRHTFDDIRSFSTLDEAKLYVESIYALEVGS